jgi:hypothetical protein
MKLLIAVSLAALVSAPAFAQQTTIFADTETANAATPAEGDNISLEGFNGGVSTTDSHDGGGGMVIQMLMPNTAAAVNGTPGPFVARAAVGASH